MTTRSYRHKIVKTQDCTNTRSYISPGYRWYWPVTCPCSHGIACMLVCYCLYVRMVSPLCSYGIASMTVQYDLHIAPLPSLVTVTGGTDLWPVHSRTVLPLTLSWYVGYDYHSTNIRSFLSHGHRSYWTLTCPGMYGIAPLFSLGT